MNTPLKILVSCATPIEFSILCQKFPNAQVSRRLENKKQSFAHVENLNIVIVCTSIEKAAYQGTLGAIEKFKPELIVDTGGCGALDPNLKIGQWIEAESVVDLDGKEFFCLEKKDTKTYKFLTVSDPVEKPEARLFLFRKLSVVAVNMESTFSARAAKEKNIPYRSVRVVTDLGNEDNLYQTYSSNIKKYLSGFWNFIDLP